MDFKLLYHDQEYLNFNNFGKSKYLIFHIIELKKVKHEKFENCVIVFNKQMLSQMKLDQFELKFLIKYQI
ncbi:hypothetical protein BpHYR1_020440 [Brachionus plicatilis]|uniref:Uncharacterized protein n=1 Tax=Brachionus plicatilis TaxID=10195 RepID=A0A3M7P828_BRAPC|nr:hypothetical protein BpHYR1_020440 [Brachionus plicatilis]